MWETICEHISDATAHAFVSNDPQPLGGGCINEAFLLSDGLRLFFVKINTAERLDMFEAEAEGLRALASADAVRVPDVICCGVSEGRSFLVLEYIEMGGFANQRLMGEQLALLHKKTAERFGWHRDNTIGSTPQLNTWTEGWVGFYRKYRLGYQFDLATKRGRRFDGSGALMECLGKFFEGYTPKPSLLHGDLWGGNASYDTQGQPVVFDPAIYYGDREADIAFTEMFGGFGRDFYEAYNQTWQLDAGYAIRRELYNLYHLLNHYNLFGGHYGNSAQSTIARLLC